MRFLLPAAVLLATGTGLPNAVAAQTTVRTPADLRHYNVTIRRFDPTKGPASGQDFVLPVDSPDEEHAIASTLANAASWPGKLVDGRPVSLAFMAIRIAPR